MVFEGFITLTSVCYQNVTRIYSWVHIKATFNFTVPFSCVIYGDGYIFQLFEQFCRLAPLKQLTCQILYLKSNSITSIVLWRLIELCWIYALATVKLYLLCILFVCTIVSYGSKRPKTRTHELQWNTEKFLSSWSWQPLGNYHKGGSDAYISPAYIPNGISQTPSMCNWVWHCITWDFIFRLAVVIQLNLHISTFLNKHSMKANQVCFSWCKSFC